MLSNFQAHSRLLWSKRHKRRLVSTALLGSTDALPLSALQIGNAHGLFHDHDPSAVHHPRRTLCSAATHPFLSRLAPASRSFLSLWKDARPLDRRAFSSTVPSSPPSVRSFMKWILIRNRRPWNFDDKFALLTWFFLLNSLFLLFATTTYASCVFSLAELLDLQDFLICALENYLSYHTGLSIKIQGQVEHGWRDGKLIFRNISVNSAEPKDTHSAPPLATVYALLIDHINVRLSMLRFLEGRGLIKNCHVSGVDGSIDRRILESRPIAKLLERWGDFDIEDFLLKDASLFVKYPEGYRSYPLTIMSAHCASLRKQWLLYDILRAEHVIGTFDHCLFNLRTPSLPQRDPHGVSSVQKLDAMRHLRVDGVKIEHLNANSTGPLSWITRGTADINAILVLPSSPSGSSRAPEQDSQNSSLPIPSSISDLASLRRWANSDVTQFRIDVKLKNLRTAAPFYSEDLSLVNNTLIKPILAYMNEHRPCIPLSCHFAFPVDEFRGAWTLYDSGLTAELYQQVYSGFVRLVEAERRKVDTYKRLGWWSLSTLSKNFYALYGSIFHLHL